MPLPKTGTEMVLADRLVVPGENHNKAFPGLGFRDIFSLETAGEEILISDPVYLADVYNSRDPIAGYLRDNGVFLMGFGGDVGGPIWWNDPYVVMPLSQHYAEADLEPAADIVVLFEEIGCDSGSFMFLPMASQISEALRETIKEQAAKRNAALLSLPAGRWTAFYEQFSPEPGWPETSYRNIILKWEQHASRL